MARNTEVAVTKSGGVTVLESGPPWNLRCEVTAVGRDLECRITGGDAHVGAVAVAHWSDSRVRTECFTVPGHREDRIATNAAHRLCAASRRTVVCLSGIHFDGIDKDEIAAISQTAFHLIREAAGTFLDQRLEETAEESGLLRRIEEGADGIAAEFDEFARREWDALIAANGTTIRGIAREAFAGEIRVFAPLYLSNACVNNCVYCGFRKSARFQRRTLSAEEALEEARALAERGYRTIDLVTGEIPTDRFVEYVAGVTARILAETDLTTVNLNIGALTGDQYDTLRQAGARGYHLYQECYDPAMYFRVHESGNKRDMAARIEGLHRAVAAGFAYVGLGVLLGLADPAAELARLVRHAEVLKEDFPGVRLGFSLPRIQRVDRECEFVAAATVSDDLFARAMLFLRLRFPEAHVTLTTRESERMRDLLLPLGVTKMSAGVSTAPGGYSDTTGETEQFGVADRRSLDDVCRIIRNAGLTPVFD